MNRTLTGLVWALAALACAPALAAGLPAIADANTDQSAASSNFGSNGIVAVSTARVALIRFNATQVAQAAGSSATLSVKVLVTKNFSNGVAVRLITSAWNETSVTASTLPAIAAGALDQKTITGADQGKLVTFNISAALAAWKSNPATNFGIALVGTAPAANLQLGSREGGNPATLTISGPAADNDATVSPSGGDYTSPVTAASNAFAGDKWCVSPTAAKPCTIHVAAGVYPLTATVVLPDGINLIGEGKGDTLLVSGTGTNSTVQAKGSLISDLSIVSAARAVSVVPPYTASLRLERVSLTGSGFGVLELGGAAAGATVTDSEITARGSAEQTAVDCEDGSGHVKMVRSHIAAISTSGLAQGFTLSDGTASTSVLELEDSSLAVTGTTRATALTTSDDGTQLISFTRSQIDVSATGAANGLLSSVQALSLQLIDSQMNLQGGQSAQGISWSGSEPMILDGTSIRSSGNAARFSESASTQPPTTTWLSVLRSTLQGGGVGLELVGVGARIEGSYISGATALTGENATLHASASSLAGPVQLQTSAATCDHVLDANLAFRPATCVSP